jgi:hypothetical protein
MVPTLNGKKKYEFTSLKRREAMEVAHTTLITVLGAVGNVAGLMFRESGDEDEETRNAAVEGILAGLSNLKFETVWTLAESILRDVVIEDDLIISDINESDYFVENLDEFYSALVMGIEGNYPSVFLKVREGLKGFDLPNGLKSRLESDETSKE